MPVLTALIFLAFAAYGFQWYRGELTGNFTVLLFAAVVVSGVYWLAEKLVGRASECWCCSFWRGGLYGGLVGLLAGYLL